MFHTEGGGAITCKALILATGTARSALKVKGEKELVGKAVGQGAVAGLNAANYAKRLRS